MILLQQKRYVLGTDAYLSMRIDNEKIGNAIYEKLWRVIEDFNQRFSRFIPTSDLSMLNKNAGHKTKLSAAFITFLKILKKMAKESDGLFNPFVLPALQKAGYLGSWPKVDTEIPEINFSPRTIGEIKDVKVGKNWAFLPPNSAIDSGGLGKGYLLDQLSFLVEENSITNYWFSLGGDLICAGNDEEKIGWQIEVKSARKEGEVCDIISTNGKKVGIATSGIIKRRGLKDGNDWHHIIDPRTNLPAKSDVLTATVVAKTATLADIYAKAIVILGSEKATKFIRRKNISLTIIQTKDGTIIKEQGD